MAVINLPWPTSALPSRVPGEGQGDLCNAYACKVGQFVEIRRTPGLRPYIKLASSVARIPRGMYAMPGYLIHAWDGELYTRRANGSDVGVVALPGAGPVTMASNLRPDGPQVVIVTDLAAYHLNPSNGALVAYPDVDLGSVLNVEYFSGYFFFARANGEIVASDLQNLDIDPLSIARAEYSPDQLMRLKSVGNALLAFGSRTTEVWVDVGGSPFPCTRQTAIDVGLLGRWAVGGGANVWGNGVFFVASDYSVRLMDGLTPKIISNDPVAHDIYKYRDDVNSIYAQVYDFENQAICSISTPDWTWEYNLVTNAWHRRDSYKMNCWRGYFAANINNRWYVQDGAEGAVLEVAKDVFDEPGMRMRFRAETGAMSAFPASVRIPSIDINAVVATGVHGRPSPYETNPAMEISWSHDGGANWSNPVLRSFGREGRFGQKITVNGLGRSTSQGCRIRADVTDPVPVVIRGGMSTDATMSRARQVGQ
jgi:hypothetical protein